MRVGLTQPRLRLGDIEYNKEQVLACAARAREGGAELVLVPHLALLGGRIQEAWGGETIVKEVHESALESLRRAECGVTMLLSGVEGDEPVVYAFFSGSNTKVCVVRRGGVLLLPSGAKICVDWCGDGVGRCADLNGGAGSDIQVIFDTSHDGAGPCALPHFWQPSISTIVVRHGGMLGNHLCVKGSEFISPSYSVGYGNKAGMVRVLDTNVIDVEDPECKSQEAVWFDHMVYGVREFFASQGLQRALVGLSGGIDSAVVLTVAVEALGPSNVMAVFMPSRFTSSASAEDAGRLARTLGVQYHVVPIDGICSTVEGALGGLLSGERGTAEENIQARIRGLLLMAISNKQGHALLNTSNKSEAAVGYTTMYGDMCGVLCVMGELYKTQVYRVARWINRLHEVIPERIITRPPSAELRAGQCDQDSLPSYEVLDMILQHLLEGAAHSLLEGIDGALVTRVRDLVSGSAFKRAQMPPILKWTRHPFHATIPSWVLGSQWID